MYGFAPDDGDLTAFAIEVAHVAAGPSADPTSTSSKSHPTSNLNRAATVKGEDNEDDKDDKATRKGAGKRLPAGHNGEFEHGDDNGGAGEKKKSAKNKNSKAADGGGSKRGAGKEKGDDGVEGSVGDGAGVAGAGQVWVEVVPEDHNTDVGGLCCRGGDLLCCDSCPRAFHVECLGVDEDDLPEGDWMCDGEEVFDSLEGGGRQEIEREN